MKDLKAHRIGAGRWRRFPFHYTLLALCEMDFREAIGEMRYAASLCEKLLKRSARDNDTFGNRRRAVAERILGKC